MKDIVIRKCVGLKDRKVVFSLCPHNLAWTENNLPGLNGIKAIDNRVYTLGTERLRYVINIRPEPCDNMRLRTLLCYQAQNN